MDRPVESTDLFTQAQLHHQAGRFDQAASLYRSILSRDPNHADALHLLGVLAYQAGQLDPALALISKAIALRPSVPQYHSNLGLVQAARGQTDDAIAAYQKALAMLPGYPEALHNLGDALSKKGDWTGAVAVYRQALNLRPDYPPTHRGIARAFRRTTQLDKALAHARQAIRLAPDYADAHYMLGTILRARGEFEQAIGSFRKAIEIEPDHVEALGSLGSALKAVGQIPEALACYERSLSIKPNEPRADSNRIYTMLFSTNFDGPGLLREHQRWNERHADPLGRLIHFHQNDPSPARRLKIGYVSPDFRQHVVGWNILPLWSHHDRSQFEIFAYASVDQPDAMTEKLRGHCDVWRDISKLSDDQAAEQIRSDEIDILVDLTLHMAGNRLLVFARKPAPVQVTYLAYAGTSGMSAMDYRFSDRHLDPPGTDLTIYTEQTVRLPESYWCYEPGGEAPDVQAAPVLTNDYLTFGCLNNFAKVSTQALELWTRILAVVPSSHLLLHAPRGSARENVQRHFARHAISADRLEWFEESSWINYMSAYHRIDIALDPFPYGGGITSCDALWMGVPVITLSGKTAVGRGGRSILSNIGLPELIAQTPEQYLQLATDARQWITHRATLRDQMRNSPLMDADRFARDVETAYRQMWTGWCEQERSGDPVADSGSPRVQ